MELYKNSVHLDYKGGISAKHAFIEQLTILNDGIEESHKQSGSDGLFASLKTLCLIFLHLL